MPETTPYRYGVVGSGWRSQFFLRLARQLPDLLTVTGVVTRSAERGEEVTAQYGVPAFRTTAELTGRSGDGRPEFVIASVPWGVTPDLIRELVAADVPVLAETPPAPDADGLRRLWHDVGDRELVQVAEQYLLLPDHAARLALIGSGLIGDPTSVQVSSTHMYHAVSMIRGLLGTGFADTVVSARKFAAPLADPLSPAGWSDDYSPTERSTTIATLDFGAGRMGLYDFTDNQWWNPLRSRRIVVRGSAGELVDDRVVRFAEPRRPVESPLVRRTTGRELNLEGFDLEHVSFEGAVVWRNPYAGARLADEEIAITSLLAGMGAWVRGDGPPPYPLAVACEDHLLSLAMEESAKTHADVLVDAAQAPWRAAAG